MRMIGVTRSDKVRRAARWMSFAFVTAAIWSGHNTWRPAAPILGLRHIEHLGLARPEVSLTFDDAPHPLTTPLLLAVLRRTGVKATFFVVGDGMRLYPELARRIVQDQHALANHSQYHHNLTRVASAEYAHEVQTCFRAIRGAGQEDGDNVQPWATTRLFRPPGGGMNREVMQYLYDNDVTLAWWSNNVGDWSRPPAWKIATQVKASLRPGDIILLHDAGTGTPQAIPSIVKEARLRGLQFVPMPERRR